MCSYKLIWYDAMFCPVCYVGYYLGSCSPEMMYIWDISIGNWLIIQLGGFKGGCSRTKTLSDNRNWFDNI